MSVVYWIHLPEHTDMFTEGYIGVSKHSANSRFNQHKSKAKNGGKLKIHYAIRKHPDIVVTTILEGSSEYCYLIEKKLRNTAETGWNLSVGGEVPHGLPHTEEFKEEQRQRRTGKKASQATRDRKSAQCKGESNPFFGKTHTDEAREKISNSRKSLSETPWLHPRAVTGMWLLCQELYNLHKTNNNVTAYSVPKFLNISRDVANTMLDKIKSGWIPNEDPKWLLFKSQGGLSVH